MSYIRHRSNDSCGVGNSAATADTGGSSADMEKPKSNHANDDRWGVHPILYTHSSGSGISGRCDYTCRPPIPRGTCSVERRYGESTKCTLTLHWHTQLKGAASRPGMHPVTILLPPPWKCETAREFDDRVQKIYHHGKTLEVHFWLGDPDPGKPSVAGGQWMVNDGRGDSHYEEHQ